MFNWEKKKIKDKSDNCFCVKKTKMSLEIKLIDELYISSKN